MSLMRVVTKLELSHDFDSNLHEIINLVVNQKTNADRQAAIDSATKSVRAMIRNAYSLGVEQGIKQEYDKHRRKQE